MSERRAGSIQARVISASYTRANGPKLGDARALLLVGALDEAALYVARAPDPAAARAEMGPVVHRLVTGLL